MPFQYAFVSRARADKIAQKSSIHEGNVDGIIGFYFVERDTLPSRGEGGRNPTKLPPHPWKIRRCSFSACVLCELEFVRGKWRGIKKPKKIEWKMRSRGWPRVQRWTAKWTLRSGERKSSNFRKGRLEISSGLAELTTKTPFVSIISKVSILEGVRVLLLINPYVSRLKLNNLKLMSKRCTAKSWTRDFYRCASSNVCPSPLIFSMVFSLSLFSLFFSFALLILRGDNVNENRSYPLRWFK